MFLVSSTLEARKMQRSNKQTGLDQNPQQPDQTGFHQPETSNNQTGPDVRNQSILKTRPDRTGPEQPSGEVHRLANSSQKWFSSLQSTIKTHSPPGHISLRLLHALPQSITSGLSAWLNRTHAPVFDGVSHIVENTQGLVDQITRRSLPLR